ncbi:hypothetical protein AK812_SmicGene31782 [Symbiodinium microadriaticum]|uniref:Uncharacterized protein n=1 Tax=Symbiodinium microadriaticum TaxID=2951 RepID=A0A1Q9CVT5_SYMMI|nr:hypothetical protein AK812_SmicGene31782 [Symbiodinium microadriaticum]
MYRPHVTLEPCTAKPPAEKGAAEIADAESFLPDKLFQMMDGMRQGLMKAHSIALPGMMGLFAMRAFSKDDVVLVPAHQSLACNMCLIRLHSKFWSVPLALLINVRQWRPLQDAAAAASDKCYIISPVLDGIGRVKSFGMFGTHERDLWTLVRSCLGPDIRKTPNVDLCRSGTGPYTFHSRPPKQSQRGKNSCGRMPRVLKYGNRLGLGSAATEPARADGRADVADARPLKVAEFQTDVTMETDEDLEAQLEEFLEQNPEQVAEVKHKAMKDKAHAVSLNTETACDPKDVEDADTDPKDVEDADTEPPGKETALKTLNETPEWRLVQLQNDEGKMELRIQSKTIAAEDAYPVWSPTKTTVVWYGQGPLKLSDLMKDREVIGIDFSAYENGSFPKQPSKVAWEGSAEAQHILEGFAAMKTPPEPIFEVTTVNASEAQLSDHSKGKRRKIQKGVIIKEWSRLQMPQLEFFACEIDGKKRDVLLNQTLVPPLKHLFGEVSSLINGVSYDFKQKRYVSIEEPPHVVICGFPCKDLSVLKREQIPFQPGSGVSGTVFFEVAELLGAFDRHSRECGWHPAKTPRGCWQDAVGGRVTPQQDFARAIGLTRKLTPNCTPESR